MMESLTSDVYEAAKQIVDEVKISFQLKKELTIVTNSIASSGSVFQRFQSPFL